MAHASSENVVTSRTTDAGPVTAYWTSLLERVRAGWIALPSRPAVVPGAVELGSSATPVEASPYTTKLAHCSTDHRPSRIIATMAERKDDAASPTPPLTRSAR